MSFLRPEAAETLTRWREALAGIAALGLGLWCLLTAGGALWLIGLGLAAGGALLTLAGIQRGRFRAARGGGAGVVQVDEGQLAYFGPLEGGIVAVDDIRQIDLAADGDGARHWVIHSTSSPALVIPTGATGADALFDVFAALPGLSSERIVAALGTGAGRSRTLWRRGPGSPPPPRLRLH